MKVRAIIQARMGSSRLRGKSLMPVAGAPLLSRVVEMVKGLPFINEVMIATTSLPEDQPIVSVASSLQVKVFQGSALDVLDRFVGASNDLQESDCIVRFTADNPFNHYALTTKVFELHTSSHNDYTHIDGLSHIVAEFISVRALRDAFRNGLLDNFDREHVTPYFRKRKNDFKVLTLPPNYGGLRHDLDKFLTIDNSEDLYRAESLIRDLKLDRGDIPLEKVYDWLDKNVFHSNKSQKDSSAIQIDFAGTPVGDNLPTYIIAEIGQNHNGDVRTAKKLIDMAVRCGANAVKFQKRDIESELTAEAFNKPYDNPNSFGKTYGEHRIFLELNEAQHLELKEYANAAGITYFCTPCDTPSVDMLERIGCPFFKVASRDLTNIPLLERLGKTGKPVIISTGMADLLDITDALKALKRGPDSVVIMQCTSEYPCKLENVNLLAMGTLRKEFGHLVGLSDHTSGVVISSAASVMGAVMIEKHITLDRTMKGTDQPGSLEEAGLKKLVEYIRAIEIAKGDGDKIVNPATQAAKEKLARSITSAVAIPKGTTITEQMLCLKSPGTGLAWRNRDKVLGKKTKRTIEKDVTIFPDDVE
jgi:sialic acid synthase SpsE/spore coat polysaccharide biosynthesis protein SpsF (cytidylyltransferase family)